MTAQDRIALAKGSRRFLVAGDVFRRDCIDTTHYPVFHQLDGVSFVTRNADMSKVNATISRICQHDRGLEALASATAEERIVVADVVVTLERLVSRLFSGHSDVETRWLTDSFPYTHPSLQMEMRSSGGQWSEILGCGVLKPDVYSDIVAADGSFAGAWAFGLGLERLAMALHGISDIRLFWCNDPRFVSQFRSGPSAPPARFMPFSNQPPIHRDISLACASADFTHTAELADAVRAIAGDLVESMEQRDAWQLPDGSVWSHTFRVTYRAMNRTLTDAEVNAMQDQVRSIASSFHDVCLR